MGFRLKPGQESFSLVDGKHAGKKFNRGQMYEEVPPEVKDRFEEDKPPKTSYAKEKEKKKKTDETDEGGLNI